MTPPAVVGNEPPAITGIADNVCCCCCECKFCAACGDCRGIGTGTGEGGDSMPTPALTLFNKLSLSCKLFVTFDEHICVDGRKGAYVKSKHAAYSVQTVTHHELRTVYSKYDIFVKKILFSSQVRRR